METLNLNDVDDGSMVPILSNVQQSPPAPPINTTEKNIRKQQITMDSTPISDIMGPADSMMMDHQQQQQPMMMPPQAAVSGQPSQKAMANASKNPLGMTDEQYQALIAGLCAIVAFSNPIQEKLLSAVPQFMADGARTTSGLIASGLIAAIIFYFVQRMLIKH
jgi:hypothetical protein